MEVHEIRNKLKDILRLFDGEFYEDVNTSENFRKVLGKTIEKLYKRKIIKEYWVDDFITIKVYNEGSLKFIKSYILDLNKDIDELYDLLSQISFEDGYRFKFILNKHKTHQMELKF